MGISDSMYSSYEDEKIRQQISHAIREGMWPFDSGKFQIYAWYDIDYFRTTLKVVVERLPEYAFEYIVDHSKLIAYPESYVDEFVSMVFKHFRYRRPLPVDDHIQLGED